MRSLSLALAFALFCACALPPANKEFEQLPSTVQSPVLQEAEGEIPVDGSDGNVAQKEIRRGQNTYSGEVFTLTLLAGLYGEKAIVRARWGDKVQTLAEGLRLERSKYDTPMPLESPIPPGAIFIDIKVVDPGRRVHARSDDPNRTPIKDRFTYADRVLLYSVGRRDCKNLQELEQALGQIMGASKDPGLCAVINPLAGASISDAIPVLDAAVAAQFKDIRFSREFDSLAK